MVETRPEPKFNLLFNSGRHTLGLQSGVKTEINIFGSVGLREFLLSTSALRFFENLASAYRNKEDSFGITIDKINDQNNAFQFSGNEGPSSVIFNCNGIEGVRYYLDYLLGVEAASIQPEESKCINKPQTLHSIMNRFIRDYRGFLGIKKYLFGYHSFVDYLHGHLMSLDDVDLIRLLDEIQWCLTDPGLYKQYVKAKNRQLTRDRESPVSFFLKPKGKRPLLEVVTPLGGPMRLVFPEQKVGAQKLHISTDGNITLTGNNQKDNTVCYTPSKAVPFPRIMAELKLLKEHGLGLRICSDSAIAEPFSPTSYWFGKTITRVKLEGEESVDLDIVVGDRSFDAGTMNLSNGVPRKEKQHPSIIIDGPKQRGQRPSGVRNGSIILNNVHTYDVTVNGKVTGDVIFNNIEVWHLNITNEQVGGTIRRTKGSPVY